MPIYDETASVVAMARVVRDGLDMTREHAQVRTAMLRLLLDTLIDLGASPVIRKRSDDLSRTVLGQTMSIAKAQEAAMKVFEAESAAMEARRG